MQWMGDILNNHELIPPTFPITYGKFKAFYGIVHCDFEFCDSSTRGFTGCKVW